MVTSFSTLELPRRQAAETFCDQPDFSRVHVSAMTSLRGNCSAWAGVGLVLLTGRRHPEFSFAWTTCQTFTMSFDPSNPLIVQADRSVFLEAFNPRAEAARIDIAPFAELVSSPEHLHTYRVTPLSLWNAASAGVTAQAMVDALARHAKFPLPDNVATDIRELAGRWGRLRLEQYDSMLLLIVTAGDEALLTELARHKQIKPLLGEAMSPTVVTVPAAHRGVLKQALIEVGWPVDDQAGYTDGNALAVQLSPALQVRDYQWEAAQAFYRAGSEKGGSGVVVLAPGSGKTVVGLVAMSLVGQRTLILTTNRTSVNQWSRELLGKTQLMPDDVSEYAAFSRSSMYYREPAKSLCCGHLFGAFRGRSHPI